MSRSTANKPPPFDQAAILSPPSIGPSPQPAHISLRRRTRPARILLLDEITEGLAPVIVQSLGKVIRLLKKRGYTLVLVEQNFRFTAELADRYFVLEHGKIVERISKDEFGSSVEKLNRYLSV